jgi:SAM-dependent methyltransferase
MAGRRSITDIFRQGVAMRSIHDVGGLGLIEEFTAPSDQLRMPSFAALHKCPVCDGTSFRPLPVPGRWIGCEVFDAVANDIGLVRCTHCGLHFINPRPSDELLDAFYSGDTYGCHDPEGSASAGSKAEFLLQQIECSVVADLPRTLLDYGCGGGAFIRRAIARGWNAQGFEPGRRGREACLRGGLEVAERVEQLPEVQFSAVTLHHVFEHLQDHAAILKGIQRVLAPGGLLFIEVPNVRSLRARLSTPWSIRKLRFDERHRAFPIHLSYFDSRTLRHLLERSGWSVVNEFTAGLGLDELRIKPPQRSPKPRAAVVAASHTTRLRWLRQLVKKLVLGSGLGENLCVFATPRPRVGA